MLRDADSLDIAHPGIRHLRVDTIWIWDSSYERTLRHYIVLGAVKRTDPVLWYKPSCSPVVDRKNEVREVVFDVTPLLEFHRMNSGISENYYSYENVARFLTDIFDVVREVAKSKGLDHTVAIKHKRSQSYHHDSRYLDYVSQLALACDNFEFLDEVSDIYETVDLSDIVISIPFTSTTHIAALRGTPAIFNDATSTLRQLSYSVGSSQLVGGRADLLNFLNAQLTSRKS